MAGLKGPARNEFQPGVMPGSGDGEVMLATGGRTVLPGVSVDGLPKMDRQHMAISYDDGDRDIPNDASKGFGSLVNGL